MRFTALALTLATTMAVPSAFADKGKDSHGENREDSAARRQGALLPLRCC